MGKMAPLEVRKLAKREGFRYCKREPKQYQGYDVYELHNAGISYTGYPVFALYKDGVAILATGNESKKIMNFFCD